MTTAQSIERGREYIGRAILAIETRGIDPDGVSLLDQAVSNFVDAVRFDPLDANAVGHCCKALLARGQLRCGCGDLAGGIADLEMAAQLDPGNTNARTLLPAALVLSGEPGNGLSQN